jgi:HlyD family secretion protein
MRRLLKWGLVLGVLAGVAAASRPALLAWWSQRSIRKYQTAVISRGRIETVVNSTGTVKPVRSVSVGAFTSGPIAEIYVDFNSRVKADQVIARIDAKLAKAAVDRDRAALETQKAELTRIEALLQQARNNEQRARKLMAINKDYLSDTEMDQYKFTTLSTEAQRKLAVANITQAEANLKNSEANLGYTEIISPVDGIVIERKVDPGQTVAASFQTPELFVIAPDMDKHMHVYASVDEADIGLITDAQKKGNVVKFTVDAYPGDLFEGKIHQIRKNSTTTQNVVTYPVLIEAGNRDLKLMPGMTANISFQVDAKQDVLRLPVAALRFVPTPEEVVAEDKHFVDTTVAKSDDEGARRSASEKAERARNRNRRTVWIQDGPLLRAVSVTLGLIDSQFAEIVDSSLAEGQSVVTGTETPAPR